MKKILFTTLLIAALSQIGFAQNIDKSKLDNYFNALEANNKFMGSVAVSKGGVIIYSKSVGFSDVENKVRADANSKYRIGSISKTFTSVLVLKAVEGKKLTLNQTIDKYFPTIKNAGKITIEDLLRHRSGIHNFTNDKGYLTWNTQAKTEKEMVEIIANGGSDFQPGNKAAYSNSNFVLLSYILEKTYKKPYADLLLKYIIQPVGLTNTSFGGKINPKKNECKSYSFAGTWKAAPETDMSIPMGAGGIVSTPSDMTKFSDALFSGKLLKPESLKIMKTIKDHYGIGLLQMPFYERTGYGHTGGIDGFTSIFSHFDDGNVSYALTSNGTGYSNNDISIAVLSAVYDKPYDIPDFSTTKTYAVTSKELDKYVGVYASAQLPVKITVTRNDKTLFAQATGQSAFGLEATDKDKFKFEKAGIVLEFNPSEKTMLLKQGGGKFTFTKE